MQADFPSWERALLSLAYEGRHADSPGDQAAHGRADEALLERAYAHCAALTAANSRSFHLASGLLPRDKRRAVRALYAFCRVTDDIVDCAQPGGGEAPDAAAAALDAWRRRLAAAAPPADDLVAVAWADARRRYRIPQCYADQLIDGVARDLSQRRYATFADLAAYSYGVASTVGLMSMHVVGYAGPEAIPYAVKLGVALQLTNILRDVAEDWQRGRLYLPLDELAAFGLAAEDVAAGVAAGRGNPRWRNFMRFQIERNRRLYAESRPGIALLDLDGRFAIAAAADLYCAILADIERHGHDNLSRRAFVPAGTKLAMLPGVWWRSQRA
jgi:phytoene synthase